MASPVTDERLTRPAETPSPARLATGPLRISALDGLRGLAVAAVICAHCLNGVVSFAPLGTLGVDLFFVLSGFLITGILFDSRLGPHYFRNFFARRALRLFPLAYAYLAIVAAVGVYHEGSWWWYVGYVANLKPGGGARDEMLDHWWSLAIEQQFYCVWPFLCLFLTPRRLGYVCGLLMAIALCLRCSWAFQGVPTEWIYRHTATRIDSICMGALVAVAIRSAGEVWIRRAAWGGAGVLVLALAAKAGGAALAVRTAGQTGAALAFAGLVLHAATRPNRWLTWRPLVRVGEVSYAMYLLHLLSLAVVQRARLGPWAGLVLTFGVTWLAAEVSWRYLEIPAMRLKRYFGAAAPSRA